MPAAPVGAVACLTLASAWQAGMILADCRRIRRRDAPQRRYRTELGWTDAALVERRRRWAQAGLVAAAALALARLGASWTAARHAATAASIAAGIAILAWLRADRRLHHGRYTLVCLATLTLAVVLHEATTPELAGGFASFVAAQLYLVAGIRKLRSPGFMSGRVLVDNLAYAVFRGGATDPDFPRVVPPDRLPDLLTSSLFARGCRVASVATAVGEVAVGVGAAGGLPGPVTLGLAVPLNLAFLLVSPRRIVTFITSAFGLLLLATAHPLL